MARDVHITVSATEIPEFRRLVDFVAEVSAHADAYEDSELQETVRQCRIDLLMIMRERHDPEEFDA